MKLKLWINKYVENFIYSLGKEDCRSFIADMERVVFTQNKRIHLKINKY